MVGWLNINDRYTVKLPNFAETIFRKSPKAAIYAKI